MNMLDLYVWENINLIDIVTAICSGAMIFGGVVPYIPQYRDISRTENTEGFSLYVCLALLIANSLRILFWFGHHYELPLLIQSIIMIFAMMCMIQLCVHIKNRSLIIKGKDKLFTDFNPSYFWEWTDFLSYVEFMVTFNVMVGILMYLLIDWSPFVEFIGFTSVFVEATLGAPQFFHNFANKSTEGMSKQMVFMWTAGDIYKTTYFFIRSAPIQFWMCGILQILFDVAILLQIYFYKYPTVPHLKSTTHIK